MVYSLLAFTALFVFGGTAVSVASRDEMLIEREAPATITSTLDKRDESVTCYNAGTTTTRDRLITNIEWYCKDRIDRRVSVPPGGTDELLNYWGDALTVRISATNINGCGVWEINDNCYHILYRIMDDCDTDTTTEKQGGELWDNCGHWRLDPGTLTGGDW
ncbi:hypothetical protein DL96DRAFT_1627353 [Flagelloscypha sp. PMI_526]|nr:hypothetical protein DL96DRAFT_1627353 [Flagelloscypha sp. PMI_526]